MKAKKNALKVGDFVKHSKNNHIIFQVVEILDPVDKKDSRMIVCNRVKDLHSYLEEDLSKYTLMAEDSENIVNHNL